MKKIINVRFLLKFTLVFLIYSPNLIAQPLKGNTVDSIPPTITFNPLTNANTSNRTINNFASISDDVGISNTTKPRLYFKKSTDANAFGGNTSAVNGWKYVIASNSTSPYSFTINNSLLYGGSVSNGNVIEYFIVAQDDSNNFNSLPAGATASSNPPVANINAKPSTVYSYNIYTSTIGGPINVGTGQTYTSLTGAGGAFEAINTKIVNQDIILNITSNLTEDGSNSLNELSENIYYYGYGVKIKPSNGTMKTISGTNVPDGIPMININGADYVTIEGRVGFGGPYLTFRNTKSDSSKTGPVIQFTNGSQDCIIYKCIIESNAITSTIGSINIGNNGNNIIEINECKIRNALDGTIGKPQNCIYSNSSNNLIKIWGNDISNFNSFGILFNNVANACTIESNSIFSEYTSSTTQTCISIQGGNDHEISGNFIGGSMPDAAGLWYTEGPGTFRGITTSGSTLVANSIQGNYFQGIELTGNNKSSFIGIEVNSGKANIGNNGGNSIGNTFAPIVNSGDSTTTGILISSNDEINISNNNITSLYANGIGSNVSLKGIHYGGNGSPSISTNYITDLRSYGSSSDHDSLVSVCGILSNNLSRSASIIGNQINNISAVNPSTSTLCMGISISTTNNTSDYWSNNTISKNNIYGLTNSSTNSLAGIYGIYFFKGNPVYNTYQSISKVYNNMVCLNNDTNNNGINIKGIYSKNLNFGTDSILFNSIKISGNSTGNANSFCYELNDDSKLFLKNNIFINERSGSAGKHYSFGKTSANPSTNWIAANANYNLFYSANSATTAYWNGDKTFADFRNNSVSNANSSNVNVYFVDESIGDLHITGSSKNDINLVGIAISLVTEDYDGDTRPTSPLSPYMGADEVINSPLPITLLSFTGVTKFNSNLIEWKTASEVNSNYFEVQRLNENNEFVSIGKVKAASWSNQINSYQFEDDTYYKTQAISYYRLKLVDVNNTFNYSEIIAVKRNKKNSINLNIYPNPSSDILNLLVIDENKINIEIRIINAFGRIVYENKQILSNQIFRIPLIEFAPGIYTIQLLDSTENINQVFIKE